jgi:hypothetical protein
VLQRQQGWQPHSFRDLFVGRRLAPRPRLGCRPDLLMIVYGNFEFVCYATDVIESATVADGWLFVLLLLCSFVLLFIALPQATSHQPAPI